MLRGSANAAVDNTSAARILETTRLSQTLLRIHQLFILSVSWTRHVAALVATGCKHALPTLRGDHILDADDQ